MKLNRKIQIAAAAAVIAIAGSWTLLRGSNRNQYTVATAAIGDIDSTIAATGNCNAVVTVQVGSQVSGNIKTLFADFNTKVKKGQLIAVIDPEIFQAKVNQARANVDSAKASLANARATVGKVQADIGSAKATVANMSAELVKAQVAVRDANLKSDRAKQLFEQKVIARQDMETAGATYDSAVAAEQAAKAQLDASNSSVQSAQAQLQVAQAQVESMKAQIQQAAAALAQSQLDLDHTQIIAPVDGTVIARHMDVGQTVAASLQAPTIFDIAQDLTKMQVDTNVDEADIGKVHVGQPTPFTVDAYPGTVFQAAVRQIREAPINTQNVVTYDVVLSVDNSEMKLFPGMTANVRILASTAKDVLEVPNAALRFKLPGAVPDAPRSGEPSGKIRSPKQTLYVLGKDGQPRPVKIVAGLTNGTFTEIKEGSIQEGDQIILAMASGNAKPGTATKGSRGPSF
jgi:HlyD family secretion protein